MGKEFVVRYPGLFQAVVRVFSNRAAAIQWVRQVGKEKEATINGEPAVTRE